MRGASPGAQPKGFEIVTDGWGEFFYNKYYDIIAYKRMLSDEELKDYELEFLIQVR